MRTRSSICAIAFAAMLTMPALGQVVDFGKYPNFKGQWVRTGNPNNWQQLGGPPPLTPEYQKIWADITADLQAGGPGNWPSTFCIPAGMPAMMSFYDPMEMIVTPEITYILISHNDDSYRRVYTDGRDWPDHPARVASSSRARAAFSQSTEVCAVGSFRRRTVPCTPLSAPHCCAAMLNGSVTRARAS